MRLTVRRIYGGDNAPPCVICLTIKITSHRETHFRSLSERRNFRLTVKQSTVTTTERKIGKVTYIIEASASPTARDTITQKIQKSIKRDVEKGEYTS